jgi:peptide chain release factor subunit 1
MPVKDQLDRLAAFEPVAYPVVSLYLNAQPGPTGRDQFQTFVRKEFAARSRTYEHGSPESESLTQDLDRISAFLRDELDPSANGVAIFACSGGGLFETVQLSAPIDQHWLSIGDRPHLYPLARVESLYPRYAALLTDTNTARILVFATGEVVAGQDVNGVKTKWMAQGGWSQARFQRHIENFRVQHAKEVVDELDKIVQREGIERIVVSGDEVIMPLLREQMPKHLAAKIVDHIRVDAHASLADILATSLAAMKAVQRETGRDKVERAVGAYRAGGLGVVGPEDTLDALVKGQVEELLISSTVGELQPVGASRQEAVTGEPPPRVEAAAGEAAQAATGTVRLAEDLIAKATQTAERITFVEDQALLAPYGGVAALLRFRI